MNLTQLINETNSLLQEAFNHLEANIVINQQGASFQAIINPGIKGPVNVEYIYDLVGKLRGAFSECEDLQIMRFLTPEKDQQFLLVLTDINQELLNQNDCQFLACIREFASQNNACLYYRDRNSKEIYDELSNNNLINRYSKWKPKTKGFSPGVVLLRKTENNDTKKMYVKKLSSYNEALDYSVLKIAKSCGISVPKVKVKSTKENNCYFFSGGIDNPRKKKPDTRYEYIDLQMLLQNGDNYLDSKKLILYRSRQSNGNFLNEVPFDKLSIARFFLGLIIFSLNDIHFENLGIKICHVNQKSTAKLTLIDFELVDGLQLADNYKKEESAAAIIKSYIETTIRRLGRNIEFLIDMAEQITEEIYLEAFTKYMKNFKTTYTHETPMINEILTWIGESEMEGAARYTSDCWLQNFDYIQDLLTKQTLTNNQSVLKNNI